MSILLVQFESTVSLGALVLGILVAVSGLAVFAYGARWKSAAMVEAANSAAWEDQSRRLQEHISVLEARLDRAEQRIEELEALPDYSGVLLAISDHELKAEMRAERVAALLVNSNERQAALLGQIRDKLTPNGVTTTSTESVTTTENT